MTPPRPGLAALLAILALRVAVVAATASNSNSTTVNPSATVTLAPSLTCAAVNTGGVCNVQSVCMRCVRTRGCAFDTFVRQCVALPVDGSALYAGSVNAPFNSTDLHYCADGDARCATCAATPSTRFCEGADGTCVCPSVCDVVKGDPVICDDEAHNNTVYIVLAVVGTMVPLFVWIYCTFVRAPPSDTATDGDRRTEQRRLGVARGERAQPKSALALQLDNWRSRHDEHKVEIDKVEPLTSGYALMETDHSTAESSNDATKVAGSSANRSEGTSMAEMCVGAHTAVSAAVDTRGERDGDGM